VTFDVFDVVVTHFPFADRSAEKKRPAVVLSGFDNFGSATGVALVAMITTGRASQWPLDVPVGDLDAAGLKHNCGVRMKLATLDFRHIERKLGGLAEGDRKAVSESLKQLLPFEIGTA
jgi:mRNA interferase MazF